MKIKKIFDKNILQINDDETFSSNHKKITTTIRIIKDVEKQFSIKKKKLQISKKKIDEYIKEHYNNSLQKHLKLIKTMQFLR